MFIVALLLFLLGMFCFGIAFAVPGLQAIIFFGGILLVSAAIALPIHARAK
ncbi:MULTISPECIES: hypothetical protein [Microbacterium]|jgi:hypothetical protein|uniref:Uncharacterized protein n=1 Tax=Microbacterium ginsengisoli TaxID=400772 RepID=A0A0F0LQV8_9MICO|nr:MULTISPECIES: hypothetical protein [Microbacterium]MCK9920126.1 hypothetical protein [Microbacteriaceae bacterium K1510]KJL34841.1 hypothetical protein RR49_02730 [Microbacterium ginsengisoli]KJL35074.1 hypothetical protein RR49_02971 [Microbacterium ginsengisoli]MBN9199415.1 hypothetical protein [Microbacterium ginsengisoli]MBN9207649.1 hypothetical protein [Microbacterium ginsengisoli]|tara:strand:- start:664 stop:816 length:153 start_codon:yes stop_codon:yes gene_type:complete